MLPPSLGGRIVDVACLQEKMQVDGTPLLGPEQRTLLAVDNHPVDVGDGMTDEERGAMMMRVGLVPVVITGGKGRAPDKDLPHSSEELPAAEREARRDEREEAE